MTGTYALSAGYYDAYYLKAQKVRRLLVNATYWATGLEDKIDPKGSVEIVGGYKTLPFKFGGAAKGLKAADHAAD